MFSPMFRRFPGEHGARAMNVVLISVASLMATLGVASQLGSVGNSSVASADASKGRQRNDSVIPTCSISVSSRGDDGSWVCRSNVGCFDESTLIRMADGSDRVITSLDKGDLVLNPRTGRSAEIDYLTVGPEKEAMYRIGFAGRIVEVTKAHPFFTEQGWVQAQNLSLGKAILDEGNVYRKIEIFKTYRKENAPIVVNLKLKGGEGSADEHFVLANGVITGDLLIQQQFDKK